MDNAINTTESVGKMPDPEWLNLRQLRMELKKIGLSPSGSKADLVKRYKLAIANEDLSAEEKNLLRQKNDSASRRKSRPTTKIIVAPSRVMAADIDELSNSDSDPSDDDVHSVVDLNSQAMQDFYNKRTSRGLDNEELERRKRARLEYSQEQEEEFKNPNEYPPQYSSEDDGTTKKPARDPKEVHKSTSKRNMEKVQDEPSDDYLLDMAQMRFFDQASLELERINMQKKHEEEISQLEHKVKSMRRELAAKDQVIESLRTGIFKRGQNDTKPASSEVQEVVFNWVVMHKLMK